MQVNEILLQKIIQLYRNCILIDIDDETEKENSVAVENDENSILLSQIPVAAKSSSLTAYNALRDIIKV